MIMFIKQRSLLSYPALVLSLIATVVVAAEEQKKPNILFILADDVSYSSLGCYGGKNAKTPNIDRLASEGIQFNRAYCAEAMCAPFRAELYTGLYPVRNGVAYNHSVARPETKSVCHYLTDLGYRVGISGKVHAKPKTVFPFEIIKGTFPDGPEIADFIQSNDSPFCLFLCSHNAHPPFRSGDVSKLNREAIMLPPVFYHGPLTRKTYEGYLAEVEALDVEVEKILKLLDDSGKKDNTIVMFSSEQGWSFAFGKWTNWNLGIHTALTVRWPGRIRPGARSDALIQIADVVPTMIEVAGGNPSAHKLDGISFLSLINGETEQHRDYVYGLHNNVPEGSPYPIRSICDGEYHYLMNLNHQARYDEKHLMTDQLAKRYDLMWWRELSDASRQGDASALELMDKFHQRPAEELYRVSEDPYEMNNLVDNPEMIEVKKRLRAELKRWMSEQGDTGLSMDTQAAYDENRKHK